MSTWIPESQRTPKWDIFNRKFYCTVPYMATRSADHIRMFGTPSCGIKELDHGMVNERIETFLTIDQMVEHFRNGTVVGVKKIEDTKTIYDCITTYLNAWKRQLEHGLNNRDAPIDDLILLDQFANAVYAHAKYFFTEDVVDSLLMKQMGTIMPITRDMLIRGMENSRRKKEEEKKPVEQREEVDAKPERAPMSDFFKTHQGTLTPDTFKRWG